MEQILSLICVFVHVVVYHQAWVFCESANMNTAKASAACYLNRNCDFLITVARLAKSLPHRIL